jgi:hypothetical protein
MQWASFIVRILKNSGIPVGKLDGFSYLVFTYFNVDIIDISIDRFDKNWQCFVYPENLSWQFQINVGSVGNNFSIARSEFQTAQKAKIYAFPNPSSGSDFGI